MRQFYGRFFYRVDALGVTSASLQLKLVAGGVPDNTDVSLVGSAGRSSCQLEDCLMLSTPRERMLSEPLDAVVMEAI